MNGWYTQTVPVDFRRRRPQAAGGTQLPAPSSTEIRRPPCVSASRPLRFQQACILLVAVVLPDPEVSPHIHCTRVHPERSSRSHTGCSASQSYHTHSEAALRRWAKGPKAGGVERLGVLEDAARGGRVLVLVRRDTGRGGAEVVEGGWRLRRIGRAQPSRPENPEFASGRRIRTQSAAIASIVSDRMASTTVVHSAPKFIGPNLSC
jgi:hypothetical protein